MEENMNVNNDFVETVNPYAGFWKRFVAASIDGIILMLVWAILGFIGWSLWGTIGEIGFKILLVGMLILFGGIFALCYYVLSECGPHQATLGKRALGIKVVNAKGGRLSFWSAMGRYFGKIISNVTMYFGYCMAGFTKKRQTIHDLLVDAYVVNDSFKEGAELPEVKFSNMGLVFSILICVFMMVAPNLIGVMGGLMGSRLSTRFNAVQDRINARVAASNLSLWQMMGDEAKVEADEDYKFKKDDKGYYAEFESFDKTTTYKLFLSQNSEVVCCQSAEKDCENIQIEVCK